MISGIAMGASARGEMLRGIASGDCEDFKNFTSKAKNFILK